MEDYAGRLELLCRIRTEAKTLQEVMNLAMNLFGNPIHVSDMSRHILAHTQIDSVHQECWLREVVLDEAVTESADQSRQVLKIHNDSFRKRMPVLIEDEHAPFQRYVKTLIGQNSRPIGVLVLSAICKPFEAGDSQLLELLSDSITRLLLNDHFSYSEKDRQMDNLLIKLLDGAVDQSVNIQHWLNYHKWKLQKYCYVLAIKPDQSEAEPAPLEHVLDELALRPYCRTIIYDNTIVHVVTRENRISTMEADEQELLQNIEQWNMQVGVSRVFFRLIDLREEYQEAITALRLGKEYGTGRCFTYDEYSVYHMMEKLPAGISPAIFCHSKILHLAEADQSENQELLVTLHAYLRNARNLSRTSEELFLHRNTVRYRLNKCMAILQSDLEDGDEIFSFLLSLKILDYQRRHHS